MAPDPPQQPQHGQAQPHPRSFRNTYWLLRHGRSTANERDLIVSRPEEGARPEWGLTAEGRAQAAAAGQSLRQQLEQQPGGWRPEALLLLVSPFSRTVQTALGAGAALGVGEGDPRLRLEPALRERCFGAHELTSCSNYDLVWADDAKSTASRRAWVCSCRVDAVGQCGGASRPCSWSGTRLPRGCCWLSGHPPPARLPAQAAGRGRRERGGRGGAHLRPGGPTGGAA